MCDEFKVKYQRELNRLLDTDRNIRKRGIIKLFDDLPWNLLNNDSEERSEILAFEEFLITNFIDNQLLINIIVNDTVEKCREVALKILLQSVQGCRITISSYTNSESEGNSRENVTRMKEDLMKTLIEKLCSRIYCQENSSFPETSEELRHLILTLLLILVRGNNIEIKLKPIPSSIASTVVEALSRSLLDTFPEVKRTGAELISIVAVISPITIRLHFKSLMKGFCSNIMHQHSKTRSITLKALGRCLSCGTEDYASILNDTFIPLFNRLVNDRIATTRKELAMLCLNVLISRIRSVFVLVKEDFQILALLLVLLGDENDIVMKQAQINLTKISNEWKRVSNSSENPVLVSTDMGIDDAEVALKEALNVKSINIEIAESVNDKSTALPVTNEVSYDKEFLNCHIHQLADILLEGIDNWTLDTRKLYLRGLQCYLNILQEKSSPILPKLLACLGITIRDDETDIRVSTEICCQTIGMHSPWNELLDLLIPKVQGDVTGGDTFSHRTSAIRLLTHIVQGFPSQQVRNIIGTKETVAIAEILSSSISKSNLFDYREVSLREAIILLIRSFIDTFPRPCKQDSIRRKLSLALIYLQSKISSDEDVNSNVISDAARRELCRLAALHDVTAEITSSYSVDTSPTSSQSTLPKDTKIMLEELERKIYSRTLADSTSGTSKIPTLIDYPINKLLELHYEFILDNIAPTMSTKASSMKVPTWTSLDVSKSVFEVLIRSCNKQAWKWHKRTIPLIIGNIQPKSGPAPGTYEANMASYASIRGEEAIPNYVEIDVRLAMLALLEGMLRQGSMDWECSSFIGDAADNIIKNGLLPNLVWRVGRVEATIRKVALASTYALLKAGSIKVESLFAAAPQVVPLLVSNLDDHDVSPRQLSSLCLSIIFERLNGAFGEQAIYEIYPKLLKRLDDSHDEVRLSICTTLQMFLRCAPKSSYSSTTLEYMLDQLFVHLDDSDPQIQEAVFKVIIETSNIDKETLLKKAEASIISNRSPHMIERVINDAKLKQV